MGVWWKLSPNQDQLSQLPIPDTTPQRLYFLWLNFHVFLSPQCAEHNLVSRTQKLFFNNNFIFIEELWRQGKELTESLIQLQVKVLCYYGTHITIRKLTLVLSDRLTVMKVMTEFGSPIPYPCDD